MVIVTSWVSVGYGCEWSDGAHSLIVESASDDSNFNSRRKKRKRGSGKYIPDVWEPPGGRTGNGCEQQSPRPQGGRATACAHGWGGANIWEPPGGRTGRGAHGKPQSPVGRRGLPGEPLGGAGENCSRRCYCAPELRGRRGLTSSICVISARANIHRISPQSCPAVDHGAKGYPFFVVQARQVP